MSITFDAAGGNKTTSTTTNTFSHTVATGQSNQILLVTVDAGVPISSVAYNGTALTLLGSKSYNSGETLSLYYLLAPSTGTHNVVITASSSTYIISASTSYYGVAQTSTFGTLASNSGTGTSSTNTVTTTSTTQLVLDVVNNAAAATNTASSSQTKREQPVSSGVAMGDIAATGASMTLAWSFSSATWVQLSVAMNATSINPGLSTSPTSMTFTAGVGGANPASQTDTLSETHGSATAWTSAITYGSGSGWLSLSPSSGSLAANGTQTLTVSCTTDVLVSATYSATVTITASAGGATTTIVVTFQVLSSGPSFYKNTIIKDGPQAYYRFDETSGNAQDSSGNNSTATSSNITYGQSGAIVNDTDTAYLFNGTSSKVACPTSLSVVGWNKISVEAWVKLSTTSFNHKATIWATGTTPTNSGDGFDFWIGANGIGGGFAVGVSGDHWNQATFNFTFSANVWYHLVGMWDGTTIITYVDGVQNGSEGVLTGNLDTTGYKITIGQDPQKGSDYFPGTLDEAAIYAKALSASTVQTHYAVGIGQVATSSGFVTSAPGAVFLLINDVLYPTILQESISVSRTAADPIPTFSFTLQDDPSNIDLRELDDVVFVDTGQIPNPTHNLLLNPAMEPYTTNWIQSSPTGITLSQNAPGGLTVTLANAAASDIAVLSQTTQNGFIVPGQSYMLSAYVQGSGNPTNVSATVKITWLDQNGNSFSSVDYLGPNPPSSLLSQYSIVGIAPSGAYAAQINLTVKPSSTTNSGAITFTQVQFEPMTFLSGKNYQLTYPTPWCAPGQTNCFVLPDGTTIRQFRLFGGLITKAMAGNHVGPNRQWAVTVSGYAWLLSKQILNDTWTAQTDSDIINNIVTKYFHNVFSTANVASTNGFQNTLSYQYNGTARDALNALCTNSSYIAGVDSYWTIYYQPPGYNTLNFELSDSPDNIVSFPYYTYTRDIDGTQLGNTIFVTGATGIAALVIDAQSVATYANRLGNISGTFWRQINNSALNSTQAAIDAGIGEASEYGYARPIVHLSTNQLMVPGYTVYLTSRSDGYRRTSFLVQSVTLKLIGFQSLGLATYECTCDLGYFNPELTNILAAILRIQTSVTTGGTTTASYYGPPPPVNPAIDVMATETINFYDSLSVSVTSTATIIGIPPARYGTAQATYGSNLVGYYDYYASVIQGDSPLGYWRLDETSSTVALDSTNNHNNGTVLGGITQGQAGAISNSTDFAYLFDGTSGYVSLPIAQLPIGNAAWSVEGWFKVATTPTSERLAFSWGASVSGGAVEFGYNASGKFYGGFTGLSNPTTLTSPSTGIWHYACATYDGTTVTLYLDTNTPITAAVTGNISTGITYVPRAFGGTIITSASEQAAIGRGSAGTNYFSGDLDDMALYSYCLTPSQVANHYTAGTRRL